MILIYAEQYPYIFPSLRRSIYVTSENPIVKASGPGILTTQAKGLADPRARRATGNACEFDLIPLIAAIESHNGSSRYSSWDHTAPEERFIEVPTHLTSTRLHGGPHEHQLVS